MENSPEQGSIMTLYGDIQSGNCYKVKWVLQQLAIAHHWQHVDIVAGQTRQAQFETLNPNGKIPLLVLPDGQTLSESNAIMYYLARDSALIPRDPLQHAHMLQWQFFEQYSHEPYIAVARYIMLYLGNPQEQQQRLSATREPGYKALSVMEKQLSAQPFLVGQQPTLADISLYAYTHVAEQGGFHLTAYPAVRAWLARIEAQPGHQTMAQCKQAS